MKFSRLRLTGFKSFVEPTDLYIDPGLTGVVGPNGCGKSNIVEALRWVMGETAPRQMRSSEMDEVIFSGTSGRPARNMAEVLLTLDNAERDAPAAYNEGPEINVARRIERGSGSQFRVNGREARARDVQTLFADAASGARTTAIVNQGQVGDLVNAKPAERRRVLEEAAGITGLHARRHEAELRLRAAETNLDRLEDVIGALEEQHRGLKRQARQATRYRNLSDRIRRAEASLLHRRWIAVTQAMASSRAALALAETAVVEVTGVVARATAAREDAAAAIPPLRDAEREAADALRMLLVKRDGLEQEARRVARAVDALDLQIGQLEGDAAGARDRHSDADEALARLAAELEDIAAREEGHEAALAELTAELARSGQADEAAEQAHSAALRDLTEANARRSALEQRAAETRARRDRIAARRSQLAEDEAKHRPLPQFERALADAEAGTAAAATGLEEAQAALETAEAERGRAASADEEARLALRGADGEADKAKSEIDALAGLLDLGESGLWPPMIDLVAVEPGYEVALGAALGDDLLASGDEAAPVHWRETESGARPPDLPHGTSPLSRFVDAPAALRPRLSQVGLIDDAADGDALAAHLVQGQRLVARSGALWRWDGFRVAAGAPTAAAKRMAQRNRLEGLRGTLAALEVSRAGAAAAADATGARLRAAVAAEDAARAARRDAESALAAAKAVESEAAAALAGERSYRRSAEDAQAGMAVEFDEADGALAAAGEELASLPDSTLQREAVERAKAALEETRARVAGIGQDYQRKLADAEQRARRKTAIEIDIRSWRERAAAAERGIADFAARIAEAAEERATLAERPEALAREAEALGADIAEADSRRDREAAALADAEARLEDAARSLRSDENRLAERREQRVRREAELEQAIQSLDNVAERVRERLGCAPEAIAETAGIDPDAELPDADALEARLDKLNRERENIGPVNLRADIEAAELDTRIGEMQSEREDLLGAIAKLRHGIAGLNREGRERLLAAFEAVDGHFRTIFTQLFGGGSARLALTESEDPFESGLEVMASPPGKRLQSMSLMSGGEQALTAISLLFAVFLTNPAPVCVLDEVDAPLDDNNVDRFCNLLDQISRDGETRFLLITHHRLTMARMERLYGVTMPEPGVSQLVSVDLMAAERLREPA